MTPTKLTKIASLFTGLITGLVLVFSVTTPTFAEAANVAGSLGVTVAAPGASVSASSSVNARAAARETAIVTKGQERAQQEITRRVEALSKMQNRVTDMKRLSESERSDFEAAITAQVNTLTELKTKIDADTSTTTLKEDVQSITKSYRIFALILPQTAIAAAVDRVESIVATATDISAKLATRISAANAAGHDTATMSASLTDMNAKIQDAKTQAGAALSATVSLQPDNGDKTLMAANTAALKDAHAKIKAAETDLKAAKADAESIAKNLRTWSLQAQINATSTSSN